MVREKNVYLPLLFASNHSFTYISTIESQKVSYFLQYWAEKPLAWLKGGILKELRSPRILQMKRLLVQ